MKSFEFLNLKPIHDELHQDLREAIDRVVRSNHFILGQELEAFEASWAEYCDSKYAIGVSNGLDALILILRALEIGPGDEVIVPANSFVATALAVSAVGALPVFCDADDETFNIDCSAIPALITPQTKAIIAVHLYGRMANMSALVEIAKKHSLYLIEDAAQAHGARWQKQKAGSFGIASGFSFYPGKNLGAFGDGGAVVTSDEKLRDKIRALRSYGSSEKYVHTIKGGNCRLDELQAAVLRIKLKRLDQWIEARRQIALAYQERLQSLSCRLPQPPEQAEEHVWHLYVIRSQHRDQDQARLLKAGVKTLIHYPIPIHRQKAYATGGAVRQPLPNSEQQASQVLSLPIWVGLDAEACAQAVQLAFKNELHAGL